jgi:hypothetical protein
MGDHDVAQKECAQQHRLSVELSQVTAALIEIQNSQLASLRLGDRRTAQFDEEMTTVLHAWNRVRKEYMQHLLQCRECSNA